jgi:peptide methionine sulfoxide reductase MsrA
VQRAHRAQRGRARGLRPREDELRGAPARVLGEPRPDPGDAAGYRSGIYVYDDEQRRLAEASRACFQDELAKAGYSDITTEIVPAPAFYFAEEYHQQYLAKNPNGYCGLGGTGVSCPVGLAPSQ